VQLKQARSKSGGFTLIELVIVVVIAGILVAVGLRAGKHIVVTGQVESTKKEMDRLAGAIIGNPELANNGVRSDFGYVGDIGAMPPNLDALITNPGGYATWKGPYVQSRFEKGGNDFKTDAWGTGYTYTGGTTITSTGSGNSIVRQLAGSVAELLYNRVTGNVYDLDGTPPGATFKDSLTVNFTFPDGNGTLVVRTTSVDMGGFFSFDSIPMGNQSLEIIYQPTGDRLRRFVSVLPKSSVYNVFHLPLDAWNDSTGTGGLILVAGSQSITGGDCDKFKFSVKNTTASDIQVSSMTLTWSSPTAYYEKIKWGGNEVFDSDNPRAGSGDTASFSQAKTITAGSTVEIQVEKFKSTQSGGGSDVDISNATFTIRFSDGSVITVALGTC